MATVHIISPSHSNQTATRYCTITRDPTIIIAGSLEQRLAKPITVQRGRGDEESKKHGKNGRNGEFVDWPSMVRVEVLEETTMEVFDVELLKGIRSPMEDGLVQALKLAMECCAPVASVGPTMDEVVRHLEENGPRNKSALYSPTETRSGSITPF
ncbi:putative kinase-like protein TMKL1 [Sesbania bispinosa]|nr:putative kinase-like protein TMKL1 [Sesbania bispinosa]